MDGRSDLYSLGLTAYFGATGYPAITGDSTQKIIVLQLTEPVPRIEDARPDLPPALAAVIDRCVKKDPAERFPTAEAVVEALDAAQLAEREIPLPIRLFAGELSTLSFAVSAILIVTFLSVQAQIDNNMSTIDTWLPAVGLLAISVARVLTTVSEARRLSELGFSAADVNDGLQRVMAERVTRRNELRANARTRRRRHATLVRSAVMVVVAIAMVRLALATRVPIRPGRYATPTYGLVLVFVGFALLGAGLVLAMKSPFRMSPLERLYRIVWLGPFGRMFVRLSMLGTQLGGVTERGVGVSEPTPVRAPRAAGRAPVVSATHNDPITALEARVAELERWRLGR